MKTVLFFYLILLGPAAVLARPALSNLGTDKEAERQIVAKRDVHGAGKHGFTGLWEDLTLCKRTFQQMDADGKEYLNSDEFRNALNTIGFRVNDATFEMILIRYGDKDGHVTFDDFVSCYLELKNLYESFKESETDGDGSASEATGQRRQFSFSNVSNIKGGKGGVLNGNFGTDNDDSRVDNTNNSKVDNTNNSKVDNTNNSKVDNTNNSKVDNTNNSKNNNGIGIFG